MPTNGGLFQCVLRVSRSPDGHTADFGPQSLRQKIPFLAEKVWWRELRLGAVACWMRTPSEICKCEEVESGLGQTKPLKLQRPFVRRITQGGDADARGSRPSTAALTRAGAMNAID